MDATFDFVCKDGNRAGFVEVGLFEFFPRLQRIHQARGTHHGDLARSTGSGTIHSASLSGFHCDGAASTTAGAGD